MGRFDGYLLVSDFDGTLIGENHQISAENHQAIAEFVREGGRFCGATGRTELNVRPYIGELPLSVPWILYNGAAIFDFEKNAFVYKALLDRQRMRPFVDKIIKHFPTVNVQIYPSGPYCQVNACAAPDSVSVHEAQACENRAIDDVPETWFKILFCSDDSDEISAIEAMFDADPLSQEVHNTRSARRYFELTANGVNKGTALQALKKILIPKPRCVVAIGDYNNDIEMLDEADIAAAPESALPEVKSHADIITSCHTKNAIADLILKLKTTVR